MEWGILVPLAVALVAPVGAYVLAARRMSGKIATSDAARLWDESRDIRDDYRQRLLSAAERHVALEQRVATLEGKNNELVRENYEFNSKVLACEGTVAQLRETITTLQATITIQRAELGEPDEQR